jgi:peptide subunit release factor 1 (eRF1)
MPEKIDMHALTREELAEAVETLLAIRGRHTELVSVIVPAGANLNVVINQLEAEKSTARNIKSKTTQKNVIEALERAMRQLRQLGQQTPKNGIAIYSGNVSNVEGQEDMRIWSIIPPEEINMRLYRCDQVFIVDPLKEMLEIKELYGLFVIDRKEATIGLLEGKKIKIFQHLESGVPGKVRVGGQCLSEDTLIMTEKGNKMLKDIQIGDKLESLDIEKNKIIFSKCINKWKRVKEEIINIKTKTNKISCSYDHLLFLWIEDRLVEINAGIIEKGAILLNNSLKADRIINIENKKESRELIDIETEVGNFFANGLLVHNSSQRYHRITEGKAKDFYRECAELLKKYFFDIKNLKGILIGGPVPTKDEFLKEGLLVTALKEKVIGLKDIGYADEHGIELLVEASDDILKEQEITLEKKLMEKFFNMLGKEKNKTAYGIEAVLHALELASVETLFLSKKLDKDTIKKLKAKAEETSAKVEMISVDTEEGQQFYNISGIGAILRFAIQ